MGLFWAPLSKICHTSYIDETWHSYIWPKEDPKNTQTSWHTLSSADISIFSPKISNF